jgi:two-component system, sensor histidine kinase and response regulator
LQVERQRLQEYTQELQSRNEELDAFGHTVAHDLKNPLGAIVGYAELVEKYYSDNMDQRGLKHLARIRQAGMKMSRIIEELLLLSGLRSQQVELTPLDMTKIVADTLQRLDFWLETNEAEVYMPDNWPTAVGYGPWVEEIWTNYISNALKYGGKPPRVELGAIPPIEGMVCFWVRDNGSGISQADQARLFAPFERLNQAQIEGHGLGLSIVQRIGKKLGGEVGVRSEPGEGSTFFFTLPEARPNVA